MAQGRGVLCSMEWTSYNIHVLLTCACHAMQPRAYAERSEGESGCVASVLHRCSMLSVAWLHGCMVATVLR
jgi:hypothetical protein